MVVTGFSHPIVGVYSPGSGAPTYTNPTTLARGVEFSIEVEAGDDNNFYANNGLAETEPAMFTSGTLTLTVDGLEGEEEALIMGITPTEVAYDEGQVEMLDYGISMNPPYLGVGGIRREQMNGVVTWKPILLTKVRFNLPPVSMATSEDQIEWQTQELTASIFRDDGADQRWMRSPKTGFSTEAEAIAFLEFLLGKTA